MSKYEKRAAELDEDIRALCAKYEEFSIMCIVEDSAERGHIQMAGNLCPLCALEDLTGIVIKEGLSHNKVNPLVDMPTSGRKH